MRKPPTTLPLLRASLAGLASLALSAVLVAQDAGQQNAEEKDRLHGLEYRLLGPAAGGRVSRVCGVVGDPLTYYAATAAGGVWKSSNGGLKWEPVFDDQPVSSIGSVAVAPSDPNVVWVGSGEANLRGNVGEGNGIYRSTDAGKSWKQVWKAEGQIGTMAVHPEDPDIAFAAALGSPFGPSEERGVYRTTDGGASWERVLFVDADTGASDVCIDPNNPRILFAGTWPVRRTPWSLTSGGEGGGLWTSRDGGTTWKRLEGSGLPKGIIGRVGVQVAPSEPSRVYALIEAEDGGLFRSDDGGESWKLVNASRGLRQRAWYYTHLTVDPTNADVVWFPQVRMLHTIDGGRTIAAVDGGGWDYHDIWIDPTNTERLIVASDAGISVSRDGGATWTRPPLPLSQFYHLSVDSRRPYRVLGSLQDYGTVSGPSNSLHGDGILLSDWYGVGGGEAGHVVADPSDPEIVWAGEYLGIITRYDVRLRRAAPVAIYPFDGSGHGAKDLRYRFQWTAPIVISPHDPKTVYHAGNVLFRTRDGGQSWDAISPDLSRNDASKQQWSGGPITGDNTGVEFYGTIFAVAESPKAAGLIWAGTDDGLVHLTRNGGESWTKVTPDGAPEWGTVSMIEASRRDAGTAYVVYDAHRLDDETPYLWKTTDFGVSWTSLAHELDSEVYLHVVREDSRVRGMLYLGTERGVMVSYDDGQSWEPLRLNMPTVSVVDLAVAEDDLVVGTLGRSAWILDDLTPVREADSKLPNSSRGAQGSSEAEPGTPARPFLFSIPPAVAWRIGDAPDGSRDGATKNPPEGALITYWLPNEVEEEVKIEIFDLEGNLIRSLSSKPDPPYVPEGHPDRGPDEEEKGELTAKAGINRVAWDLRYEGPMHVPGALLEWGDPGEGPRVLPGRYEARLTIESEGGSIRPLRVVEDPRIDVLAEDARAQLAFTLGVMETFSRVSEHILKIRSVRQQLAARHELLADDAEAEELVTSGTALLEKLDAVELVLHNPKAEVGYDILAGRHGGAQLHSQLQWIFLNAREHEGPPTQGMRDQMEILTADLAEHEATLGRLLGAELDQLNALAASLGVPYVIR